MINPATLSEQRAGADLSFATTGLVTRVLKNQDRSEVLKFLRERPIQNAVMSGFISDNGIESPLNRGIFYGCHDRAGKLQGVALIGHAIFLDVHGDEALRQFAELAQRFERVHMIMGEQSMIESFWKFYTAGAQRSHDSSREVLLELNRAPQGMSLASGLRPARLEDLSLLVPVHAALAMEESGINPLDKDPYGFRMRCRHRVEQGRVWVVIEGGELIFKADIIADTLEVVYLEGIYVHPRKRGMGNGSRYVSELSNQLLQRTLSITLLVNEERHAAVRFFEKLGFVSRAGFATIFLRE